MFKTVIIIEMLYCNHYFMKQCGFNEKSSARTFLNKKFKRNIEIKTFKKLISSKYLTRM